MRLQKINLQNQFCRWGTQRFHAVSDMTILAKVDQLERHTERTGGSAPRRRLGPYIEQLRDTDERGRFRLIYDNFPGGLITETIVNLHSLLDERAREKRSWISNYQRLASLFEEIEEIVRSDHNPVDEILGDRLAHTDHDYWRDHHAKWLPPYPHRILLDAHVTKVGNLSVRFSPQCLGESGQWENAPEWRQIPLLGSAETMRRPNDEVLFIRSVDWLFENSLARWNRAGDIDRTEQAYIAAACRAVNVAFWLTYHRLQNRFEVHLGRYLAVLSSTPEAADCLGLELVDALADHRTSVKEALAAFEANTGHPPQRFWDTCESTERRYVRASKELRGSSGSPSRLTPSVVEHYHKELQKAQAYGLWKPGEAVQQPEPEAPAQAEAEPFTLSPVESERPLPRGRTVRIGRIPFYPQPSQTPPKRGTRSPTEPPDYSKLARYKATEAELAASGVFSVDELIERVNSFVGRGLQFPVTQSDFPNSKKKFDRLTALLDKLTWSEASRQGDR